MRCGSLQENDGSNLEVPHSHSSETLRADQSYTSSPNLSSAESSATLVGSIPSVDEKDEDVQDEDGVVGVAGELGAEDGTGGDSSPSREESEGTGDEDGSNSMDNTPPSSADSVKEDRRSSVTQLSSSSANNNNNSKNAVNAMNSNSGSPPTTASGANASSSRSSSRMSASRMSNTSTHSSSGSSAASQAQQMMTSLSNTMSYLRVRGGGGKRGSNDTVSESLTLTASGGASVSNSTTPRSSFQTDVTVLSTPRSSFQFADAQTMSSKAGVVVTSSRSSARRSSTASAASAFAAATAASSNPPDMPPVQSCYSQPASRATSRLPSMAGPADMAAVRIMPQMRMGKRESMISTAATMRVLNVLRHWVSKHSQDFESDAQLTQITTEFLEELVHNTTLLPAEHKAASQLLSMITKEETVKKIDLDLLLAPPAKPSKETIESLSALEIAEGMTFLDHKIFVAIMCSEFLGQGTVHYSSLLHLLSFR